MKNIKWKPVYLDSYPTSYMVSELGNVINTKHKKNIAYSDIQELAQLKTPGGYRQVCICVNGKVHRKYVHRLVAEAFIPNPNNLPEVNHKSGDKTKNSVDDLEWCTSSENKIHAYQTGLQKVGEKNSHSIYTELAIHRVCALIEENKLSPREISNVTGVNPTVILDIRNKGSWVHISKQYDFTNYTPKQIKYSTEQKELARSMLDSGKYSLKEISDKTGIPYKYVHYLSKHRKDK